MLSLRYKQARQPSASAFDRDDCVFVAKGDTPPAPVYGGRTLRSSRKGAGFSMVLYVADVDAVTAQAEAAGATIEKAPADQFHGDRQSWVRDPFGHRWSISTQKASYSPEEIIERFKAAFSG